MPKYVLEPIDPVNPDDPVQFDPTGDHDPLASESGESEEHDGERAEDSVAKSESRDGTDDNSQLMFVSESSATDILPSAVITNCELITSPEPVPGASPLRDSEPQFKKFRVHEASFDAGGEDVLEARPSLSTIPFDILFEILSQTGYPGDLLAVARTCKALCRKLTDPSAHPFWKKMRKAILLPDPAVYEAAVDGVLNPDGSSKKIVGVQNFVNNEPAYAAFVFDGGPCEICEKYTHRTYRSFALRLRLCGDSECLGKIRVTDRLTQTFMKSEESSVKSVVPVLEVSRIFHPHASFAPHEIWPRSPKAERVTRISLVEAARASEFSLEEAGLVSARNHVWMKFCVDLFKWNQGWQRKLRKIRSANEDKGRKFAEAEGWNYITMINETAFGPLRLIKFKRRELITDHDLLHSRPTISSQLYNFQQQKEAKAQLRLREVNTDSIFKLYQKLMSQQFTYPILPPFPIFLDLPAVQILRSPDLAKAGLTVKSAVSGKGCILAMIKQQVEEWAESAKREMLKTLDEPAEWNVMVSGRRMLHPVLRLDARWKCVVCNKVEPRYEHDECLDFAGVCRHQCQEEDKRKKKKGVATRSWNPSNFVKDEQASSVMNQCLERLDAEVGKEAVNVTLTKFNEIPWRCNSCNPPLILHAKSVLGHSHRHETPMQIERLPRFYLLTSTTKSSPFGLAKWLSQKSRYQREEVVQLNFGCQHCDNKAKNDETEAVASGHNADSAQDNAPSREEPGPPPEAEAPQAQGTSNKEGKKRKEFTNKFNFNGLRSHLSSKHGIFQVRDEDFWCYNRVLTFPGVDKAAAFVEALFGST